MATQSGEKSMWDDPKFSAMYQQAEKFTGTFAKLMLEQANFASDAQTLSKLKVLDNACGTGVVSGHIISTLDSLSATSKLTLTCADFSDSMVSFTANRIKASNWPSTTQAIKADAQATNLPSNTYTHIFFNFGPFLLPSPSSGMSECHRMLLPNGTLGITSWSSVPWPADLRAAFSLHPELPPFPDDETFWKAITPTGPKWTHLEGVHDEFEKAGFTDIKTEFYERTLELSSYREVVAMLPTSLGLVTKTLWTEEQREKWKDPAEKWCEEYLKEKYGEEKIVWQWTAIVGTGKKPA